jgi:hypothetical protein
VSLGHGSLAVVSALRLNGPYSTLTAISQTQLFDAVLFRFVTWLQNDTIVAVMSDHRRVEPAGAYVLVAAAGGFVGWIDEERIAELCNAA